MKKLILVSLIALSTTAIASQDKCYKTARNAAFLAVKNEEITTLEDFGNYYGDESVDVERQNGWQKEFWSFSNTSSIVSVEVDAFKGKCVVKNVDFSQNDQDWE